MLLFSFYGYYLINICCCCMAAWVHCPWVFSALSVIYCFFYWQCLWCLSVNTTLIYM